MIQQIFEGIANAIIRQPKLVAFFITAILLPGIYGMTSHSPPNVGVVTLSTHTQPHGIRNRSLPPLRGTDTEGCPPLIRTD
jgi:hypothetical protein